MNTPENGHAEYVVAGLDQHGHPAHILAVAADEALHRGLALAVVTILRADPLPDWPPPTTFDEAAQALRTRARTSLDQAIGSLRSTHPRLTIETFCLDENDVHPSQAPLPRAALLVVGNHDHYGRRALILGSPSRLLLAAADCPVLIVPRPRTVSAPDPRVVVGVSAHPADTGVVSAAYQAARGRPVTVVLAHAYSPTQGESPDEALLRADQLLTRFAATAPDGLRVTSIAIRQDPDVLLPQLSANAQLLVVGGRRGALSGLVRGSVSRALLADLPCPMLAVPRAQAKLRSGTARVALPAD
ncbi:universal stress protein [Kineosporia sp. NBRC 101731]|uniref:universal stress protein n=1 Tax=Kineosporia sp. NBRC 101731 TaxID=3032199 RepID=UPI0024A38A80|nr:universal stress protein [Kineosporia sp. NBRC 101731]GLY32163.1 universal stress protein [Kineosporia sp. NBRC 101731]